MLIRLIKFDLKSSASTFAPIYISLAVLSAVITICTAVIPADLNDYMSATQTAATYLGSLCERAFTLLAFLIPLLRFRKSYLSDEAYFTLALPVSPWIHVVSKLICTVAYYSASILWGFFIDAIENIANGSNSSAAYSYTTYIGTEYTPLQNLLRAVQPLVFIIFAQLFLYMILILSTSSPKFSVFFCIIGAVLLGLVYTQYYTFIRLKFTVSSEELYALYGLVYYKLANCIFLAFFSVIFYIATIRLMKKKLHIV